jgi:hypothetical protein
MKPSFFHNGFYYLNYPRHWGFGGLDTSKIMKTSEREWFSRGERGANTSRRSSDYSRYLEDSSHPQIKMALAAYKDIQSYFVNFFVSTSYTLLSRIRN